MANFTESCKLSARYAEALQSAFDWHLMQVRKQGEIPYISHLMSVSALVLEAGGDEDEAIAALLHDAVEDAEICIDRIRDWFGMEVGAIVESLSEDKAIPKHQRKAAYVSQVKSGSESVKLVSAGDKLHNLRGYASTGCNLWKPEHAEFYFQLMPIYEGCHRVPRDWIEEMRRLLASLDVHLCVCGSGEHWATCTGNLIGGAYTTEYCG